MPPSSLASDRPGGAAGDDLEAFRCEAHDFLARHAPAPAAVRWGVGPDHVTRLPPMTPAVEAAMVAAAKAWKAREFDAGLGWITGPQRYGGRDLPVQFDRLYKDLRAEYDVPPLDPFTISLGMVATAILAHGTETVREAYLRRLQRGDLIGCQLFSEPEAGSDLASLRAHAERAGDGWVVDGQKVWTSGAHYADIGLLLCRTNDAVPKHAGLTAFVLDMRAEGVELRPLRQMNGDHGFNEVFLSSVRIPDTHRLGAIDGGWHVARSTLMNERALGSGRGVFGIERALERLLHLARAQARGGDPVVRQQLADCYATSRVIEWSGLRADARRAAGVPPGPEESLLKLLSTLALTKLARTGAAVAGPKAIADAGEWGTFAWGGLVQSSAGNRIAAGTDEIMRNILAERVLGLPR